MNGLMIVLRLVHVVAGVLWVGTALLNTFFLGPTVAATGEVGQKFMAHLVAQAHLRARITLASYLTVFAGASLYWIDSRAFTSAWQASGPGLGFGIGGLAGLVGFGFGQLVSKHATLLAKLAGQLHGAPSPEQAATMRQASSKMTSASWISTAFLIVALALMGTARYWVF